MIPDLKDTKSLRELEKYQFEDRYLCDKRGSVYRKRYVNDEWAYYLMSPFITRDGYVEFVLTDKYGLKRHIQGHRIVAELFVPKKPGCEYVNHIDGNRRNNIVENLEWVTQSDNLKHSYQTLGRVPWNKKNLISGEDYEYYKDFDMDFSDEDLYSFTKDT